MKKPRQWRTKPVSGFTLAKLARQEAREAELTPANGWRWIGTIPLARNAPVAPVNPVPVANTTGRETQHESAGQ